jgi:hypothetical protein
VAENSSRSTETTDAIIAAALSDIHEFDFYELEFHHDYIQWLFSLPEPSGANEWAPLLSERDIAEQAIGNTPIGYWRRAIMGQSYAPRRWN